MDSSEERTEVYAQKHATLMKNISNNHWDDIDKCVALRVFHESYMKETPFRSDTGFICCVDDSLTQDSDGYITRVIDFCLHTNACEKYGLSIKDFMNMDLYYFTKLRDALYKLKPKEEAIVENIAKNQMKR